MDPQTHFGRYKVKATLGQGEMGTVYLAEDPAIGRQVAIKTLRHQPGGTGPLDDDARARFDREMRVTGTFTHPNIVTVYDVGLEDEEAFIAMAYVDGGSLGSLLAAERTLPFHRIIELTSQIASGLDYAHEQGVVHRDIKPTNILLTAEGAPVVSDFGVARMANSTLTRQGAACGSPAYMSPEQAAAREVTGASDQFSLAIITYEMLTGEVPFAGQSIATVMYRILQDDPVPPEMVNPLVPEAAGKVLMRALSKLPSARYPTCTAFADAFAEALGVASKSQGAPVENVGAPVEITGATVESGGAPVENLGAPVESLAGTNTPAQLAATIVTAPVPQGKPRNAAAARGLPPLWAALTSGLAGISKRLHLREVPGLLSGWASLTARLAGANRRPLLVAAGLVVVLATGVWFGAQLLGGDSTGKDEPSEPVTESALATVAPAILERTPAPEANDAESEKAASFWPVRRPASASVPQETGTARAGATGQESAAMVPQAADEAPDLVSEASDPVAQASDPVSEASELVSEASEPAPEVPEPVPADAEPEPTGADDPEAVDTPTAETSRSETNVPESGWTVVAEGTVPDKLAERALEAATVLDEIMSVPDQGIPSSLLARAECVAVIPNVRKVGLIFGSKYGRGLVSCRTAGGWSRPSFVSIGGGSFGVGTQSTDVVLVFANQEAAARLLEDEFTLGADASVSAGPVGTTEADTDATPATEIYSYSRGGDLFEGVALDDADLEADVEANESAYGEPLGPEELLFNDGGELPAELATFVQALAAMAAG